MGAVPPTPARRSHAAAGDADLPAPCCKRDEPPACSAGRWIGLGLAPSSRGERRRRNKFLHRCPSAPRPGAGAVWGSGVGTAAAWGGGGTPLSRPALAVPVVLARCLRFSLLWCAGGCWRNGAAPARGRSGEGGAVVGSLPRASPFGLPLLWSSKVRQRAPIPPPGAAWPLSGGKGGLLGGGDAPGPRSCLTVSLPLQDRCLRRRQGRTGRAAARGCPRLSA